MNNETIMTAAVKGWTYDQLKFYIESEFYLFCTAEERDLILAEFHSKGKLAKSNVGRTR